KAQAQALTHRKIDCLHKLCGAGEAAGYGGTQLDGQKAASGSYSAVDTSAFVSVSGRNAHYCSAVSAGVNTRQNPALLRRICILQSLVDLLFCIERSDVIAVGRISGNGLIPESDKACSTVSISKIHMRVIDS